MIQNNLFNDQVNNFNPVEKVVELYERMLKEAKDELNTEKEENQKLREELEVYSNGKKKSSQKAVITKGLHSIGGEQAKEVSH